MAQSTISDVARALLALDQDEDQLRNEQLVLAAKQYRVWLRLEAIAETRHRLVNAATLVDKHSGSGCELFNK